MSTLSREESLYVEQLSDLQRKIYEIAKTRLKTSFTLSKSIGYKEWLHKYHHSENVSLEKSTPPG